MIDAPPAWLLPDWSAPDNVRAIVATREGPGMATDSVYGFNVGTRCGDDAATVTEHRAILRGVLSLPAEPCWLHQVHGAQVVTLDSPLPLALRTCLPHPQAREGRDGGHGAQEHAADAAVTRTPGVVLAIQTADCLPVLFCAEDGSEVAAAHAGWRGLSAGVLENTLGAMHTPDENIIAWLGPAIAARSYEVGNEVRAAFITHAPDAASAFTATRPGHWSCDLYALARQRLHAAGVMRISGGGFDTFIDPHLHSYRRDGAHSGRMASLVWIAP